MREIITDWTCLGSAAKVAVMYFDDTPDINDQRAGIDQLFEDMKAELIPGCRWDIRTEGRVLDATTGTLTGTWNDPNALFGTGSATGQSAADATQVVVRWTTGAIINGRRLYGRTFVPGLQTSNLDSGDLSSASALTFLTAAQTFIGAGLGFGVWHRPTQPLGGSFTQATGAVVPSRLGVLKKRRS